MCTNIDIAIGRCKINMWCLVNIVGQAVVDWDKAEAIIGVIIPHFIVVAVGEKNGSQSPISHHPSWSGRRSLSNSDSNMAKDYVVLGSGYTFILLTFEVIFTNRLKKNLIFSISHSWIKKCSSESLCDSVWLPNLLRYWDIVGLVHYSGSSQFVCCLCK